MPNTDLTRTFDKATESADNGMTILAIIMFILNMIFAGSLKKLIGAIMSLQVVIHMVLMMLPFPPNIGNYLTKLKPIASFNVLKKLSKYILKVLPPDWVAQNENKS